MTETYYQTTPISDSDLEVTIKKCLKQEDVIKEIFNDYPYDYFTHVEVLDKMNMKLGHSKTPVSSIYRAISNLTDKGVLLKTRDVKEGIYGKNNYLWTLNI